MNIFWFEVDDGRYIYTTNSIVIEILTYLEKVAWFFHVEDEKLDSKVASKNNEINLMIPTIVMAAIFAFSIAAIMVELFGSSRLHRLRKVSFYFLRLILDIISPIMVIPTASLFGISIRNLVLFKDKINWIYLFCSLIMYVIYVIYLYVCSFCITKTLLCTFNLRIPLLLPIVSSLFVISQCIFSLFNYWAMTIVQLSHAVISFIVFLPMIYLIFHTKIANIIFIGVTMSTWFNDIIFVILHYISPPADKIDGNIQSKFHFYYITGLVCPLISHIISFVLSYFFISIRYNIILKELIELSGISEDFDPRSSSVNINSKEYDVLNCNKLFRK